DAFFPEQPACRGVHGVIPTREIAKHERVLCWSFVELDGEYGRPNGAVCLKYPMHAAGCRVQRLNGTTCAAHEQVRSDDGGRADGIDVSFKSVCPLQLQPLNLLDG